MGEFAQEFKVRLIEDGLGDCQVKPIMTKKDGSPIDHDSDPVIIEVHYPAKVDSNSYVHPVVKIEISCLSMKEPFEVRRISSLVGEAFPLVDDETIADIPTITPTRTFLEKAFLLNEEYQRNNPRTDRMSRNLYDLERLMDTPYAFAALDDMALYQEIIAHRQRFYHVGGVNYELNYPAVIAFCPIGDLHERLRQDYEAMKATMIYGEKLTFDTLVARLELLQARFRSITK